MSDTVNYITKRKSYLNRVRADQFVYTMTIYKKNKLHL